MENIKKEIKSGIGNIMGNVGKIEKVITKERFRVFIDEFDILATVTRYGICQPIKNNVKKIIKANGKHSISNK